MGCLYFRKHKKHKKRKSRTTESDDEQSAERSAASSLEVIFFCAPYCNVDKNVITIRKRKVMFLHLSVIVHRGGVCLSACWDTPPWADTHPRADTPPAQCMLVYTVPSACWDRHGYCCGRYASYWNAFLLECFVHLITVQTLLLSTSVLMYHIPFFPLK